MKRTESIVPTRARAAIRTPKAACFFAPFALALPLLPACGYSGGEFLFMTGLFPRPTVEAEFKFSEGPVAILVDDFEEHCEWPETTMVLADEIAREMKENNVCKVLIPPDKVKRLRQAKPNYDELSAREIGELLGAEQVLAVSVESFAASLNPEEASGAAQMGATSKVINVLEKKYRHKVRLWPKSPAGKPEHAELSATDVSRGGSRSGVIKELTSRLAKKIVRNFYDRKMDDFETP